MREFVLRCDRCGKELTRGPEGAPVALARWDAGATHIVASNKARKCTEFDLCPSCWSAVEAVLRGREGA